MSLSKTQDLLTLHALTAHQTSLCGHAREFCQLHGDLGTSIYVNLSIYIPI